jgi:hypothetical protein
MYDLHNTSDEIAKGRPEIAILAVGRLWHYFVPLTIDSSSISAGKLTLQAYGDFIVTFLLWLGALSCK